MRQPRLKSTFLGLDLGMTALKAVLSIGKSQINAAVKVPLAINRPKPNWSEQTPAKLLGLKVGVPIAA